MHKRAGNPSWGKQEVVVPTITEFEKQVAVLDLQPDQYVTSNDLRFWVSKHRNLRYVPEPLLKAWGFEIDTNF